MMNSKKVLLNAILLGGMLICCGAASAQSRTDALYLGGYVAPMFSYVLVDKDFETDDGKGGIGALGYRDNRWAFEVEGYYTRLGGKHDNGSSKFKGANFSVLFFPFDGLPNLYGVAGLGGQEVYDYPGFDDNTFSRGTIEAGIGHIFPIRLSERYSLGIRTEARYRYDRREKDISDDPVLEHSFKRGMEDVLLNVGLQIPFGRRLAPPVVPPPEPQAAVVPAVVACADGQDNDGDGLIDFPADPGCTSAEDPDETDPAPPPAPVQQPVVNLENCKPGDVFVLRGVTFEFNKSRLMPNAQTILDAVADELSRHPDVTVELGGHTDWIGSDGYNQRLSERRAAAVKSYLEGKGISPSRMTSVGYGESRPVADNNSDEGRELNRRVELKVTGGNTAAAPPP